MEVSTSDVLILEDGQPVPSGIKEPARKASVLDTFSYIANPDKFCEENLHQYGPIFKTGVFGGTTVFVGSKMANQMVFNGDRRYTEIALPPTTMDMFGEYSLLQRPDLHSQRKSALSPGFMGKMLEGYLPHIQAVVKRYVASWTTDSPISLTPTMEELSFDILVPILLGLDPNQTDDQWQQFSIQSKQELKQLYKKFFDGFYGLVKWRSPLTAYGRGKIARDQLMDFMGEVIALTQQQPIDGIANFLSMMLADQQDNPDSIFIDVLVRTQCLLQLWGSHYEVTALLASWLYHIGQHPDIIARLRQEQAEIWGSPETTFNANSQDLAGMKYLEATIRETLRISPPSSTANRRLTKSVVVDGYLFKKGWAVIAEPRITHIMEEYYTNPKKFDPQRFLGDRKEGKKFEFIAFGGGIHQCLGAQLAMAIMKIFGAHFIQQFDWELLGEAEFTPFPLKKIKDNYQIQLQRCS